MLSSRLTKRPSIASIGWLGAWSADLLTSGPGTVSTMPALVGDNPVQSTTSKQPYLSGDFGKSLRFDGSSDAIPVDLSAIASLDKISVYTVVRLVDGAATGNVLETTTAYHALSGVVVLTTAAGLIQAGTGNLVYKVSQDSVEGQSLVYATTFDRTEPSGFECEVYHDGVLQDSFSSDFSNGLTGNFGVGTGSWIGARDNGASRVFNGYIAFVGVRAGIDDPQTADRISKQLKERWNL